MYKRPDGLYEKKITIDGKLVPFRAKTQSAVFQKIAAYKAQVENGKPFKELAEKWKEQHWKTLEYNSTKNYNPALKRAVEEFGNTPIKKISPPDVNTFINNFAKKGYARKTVTTQLLILNLLFGYCISEGELEHNPAEYITVPKNLSKQEREMPLSEELQKVKDNVDSTFGLFAFFVYYTGCRKGEALAIQGKDIDLKNKVLTISKSVYFDNNKPKIKTPKTKAGRREVVLLDKLIEFLPKLKKDEYLFHNENGGILSETQYQRQWELYQRESKVTVTAHQLRHGFATLLFEAGTDVKDAQMLMGHANIATTMDIYTHISEGRKALTAKKLNDFVNGKTEQLHSNSTVTTANGTDS